MLSKIFLLSLFFILTLSAKLLADQAQTAEETWQEPFTGIEFIQMEGGCFLMGCGNWTSDCAEDEKPLHEVCVDEFWIGKYEVTQEQWKKLMNNNPSYHPKGSNYPVDNVTWHDTLEFINKLHEKSPAFHFKLPTEAQWEYAARSKGRRDKYSGGRYVDKVAWYGANSGYTTHPIGSKRVSKSGTFDMSGNVWEWCQDGYKEDYYKENALNNPTGPKKSATKVLRGGSHGSFPEDLRTSNRHHRLPDRTTGGIGFRLVRFSKQ